MVIRIMEIFKEHIDFKNVDNELKEKFAHVVIAAKYLCMNELVAGMSHELNQPLNAIGIICQSLIWDMENKRLDDSNLGKDLEEIMSKVNKMAETIDHMRVFIKNPDNVFTKKYNLNDIIENTCLFISQQFKNHNIIIEKKLSPNLKKIKCDSICLGKALLNIFINAREALEKSQVKNKLVKISTFNLDGSVCIEITDNGIGISNEIIDKIFDPFFTTKEPGKGIGLGLYMTFKIIKEIEGKIEVESEVNKGTKFRIVFKDLEVGMINIQMPE